MGALQPATAVFFAAHVLLFLTSQHYRAVLDAHIQIFARHAGQLGCYAQHLPLIDHVDARLKA
ncbi:hypothetical protein A9R05_39265 (plasmid) [Burkholderia sp. KK1]|nr:hypothetical protein A9R05_39265 [Burkholderia sp. KK1]